MSDLIGQLGVYFFIFLKRGRKTLKVNYCFSNQMGKKIVPKWKSKQERGS